MRKGFYQDEDEAKALRAMEAIAGLTDMQRKKVLLAGLMTVFQLEGCEHEYKIESETSDGDKWTLVLRKEKR